MGPRTPAVRPLYLMPIDQGPGSVFQAEGSERRPTQAPLAGLRSARRGAGGPTAYEHRVRRGRTKAALESERVRAEGRLLVGDAVQRLEIIGALAPSSTCPISAPKHRPGAALPEPDWGSPARLLPAPPAGHQTPPRHPLRPAYFAASDLRGQRAGLPCCLSWPTRAGLQQFRIDAMCHFWRVPGHDRQFTAHHRSAASRAS